MRWLNEPPRWREEGDALIVTTEPDTDFWRQTHYGFIRHSGHVRLEEASGNFSASVQFTGAYRDLYDQAGLMVLVDDSNWLKCGIEFTSGKLNVSSVLTRDFSDWSVLPIESTSDPVTIRVTRLHETLMVDYSLDGTVFQMIRLGYLPMPDQVSVGPMCCSPSGSGFEVTFTEFRIGPPEREGDQ